MRTSVAALVAVCGLACGVARAFDHGDGPGVLANPAVDIADVFAWMSEDAQRLNLIMTVFPNATVGAQFSSAAQYVFHIASRASFGDADAAGVDVICTFDASQTIQCWAGSTQYVTGDASSPAGIASADGKLRVFAGLRDDPEYLNLSGLSSLRAAVIGVAGTLQFDAAGCPTIDASLSAALGGLLATGTDAFASNALALVVSIDQGLVTAGGPILSVWGSTNQGA